ncbi:NTPase [Bacteroidetes bacterium UKL13-3]|nr:NTPase [Bacteroidetes bacterium UKL13-3]
MTYKHTEIDIISESPFQNCKLGRQNYANILTSIVESFPEGFVLAINNKWGTGKTTFVKMWEQTLKNSGYKTIYFNAWENDFEDNPLTAFVAELQVIDKKGDDKFNTVVKNAALIAKNVAPGLLKAIVNKYIDSETLTEAISNTSKSVLEIFEEDVKEYSKRKESISKFKKSLSEFVANESNEKQLIFIIDELDRCRPNYAVLLLEQIKHFFSVPNIVFILSIDKEQLGNAIRGVYGSEKIDANEYLRRFIDIEYSIPEPEKGKFFDYLYNYFEFDNFFRAPQRNSYHGLQYDMDDFKETSKALISSLTLRQQEKVLSHTRMALRAFDYNSYLLPPIFIFLSYIKSIRPDFYTTLSDKSATIKDVQDEFYKIVKPFITEDTKVIFSKIEAYLLRFYENDKSQFRNSSELFEKSQTSNEHLLKIESKIDSNMLLRILTNDRFNFDYRDLKLSYFLNRLNLTDTIKTS